MMSMYNDKLALLADTKETLRLTLGLGKDVPFSQYASHIPLYLKADTVFDFVNNQYAKDQLTVRLNDISEFIRLSSATNWQDGQLVEVQGSIPRISGEGLLVEEQRTNLYSRSEENTFFPGGSFPPDVVNDTFHLGVKCAAITFKEGDYVGYPGSRAQSRNWPLVKGETIVWSCQVSLSRPLVSNEAVTLYETGAGAPSGATSSLPRNSPELVESYRSVWASGASSLSGSNYLTVYGSRIESPLTVYIHSVQREHGAFPTSYIPTAGTPVSRSPDILNIPLLPTQTITGDWDEGVTYETVDNISTFTGHGYIRTITVEAL